MKNLGWQLFWALLLADAVALLMIRLAVGVKVTLIIAALIFVILAAVMFFGGQARQRIKKREEEAKARLAELKEKVTTPEKDAADGAAV
jgi:Flp pilus assembly protein TadB